MLQKALFIAPKGSIRQRIMTSVGAMVLLSLMGSILSLYRITEVNRLLEAMNHVYIPLGRLFTQMQSDAEVFHRELERSFGYSHWKDSSWRPRPVPQWIQEVLIHEMGRVSELIQNESEWATPEVQMRWSDWANQILKKLDSLNSQAAQLYLALETKDDATAYLLYPQWTASVEEWKKQLQWGAAEYERSLRQNFSITENRVADLRTNLEMILIIVVLMSLLFLWLGERALRPLNELTRLAREITRRGLRKEDKSLLPEIPLSRSDEVSQLAREFHNMATALLEREKTVESQKKRLQEQNRLLMDIGELNQNILNSIESILIVTDLNGFVTKCNPGAVRWLGALEEEIVGSRLSQWSQLKPLFNDSRGYDNWLVQLKNTAVTWRLGPATVLGRVYGGNLMPLREEQDQSHGAILVLDDLTEETNLQERLHQAESLAAVGRMSAQVAHEVRNPLHSIGLEAEMAAEMAAQFGNNHLNLSLHSILTSVDRLQKITDNYLKLSRLSDGRKSRVNIGEILNSVLLTYAPLCEVQNVTIHFEMESKSILEIWADRDLIEQVFGNLLRNSLQALEEWDRSQSELSLSHVDAQIHFRIGNSEKNELWLRVEDNGPGIEPKIKERLFTPFLTTRAQGTGLGLSFVKKVLEDHGGSIRSIDRSFHSGACFELILPLIQVEVQEGNDVENIVGR